MEPAHDFMSADELEALGVVRFLTSDGGPGLKIYLLTVEGAMVTQNVEIITSEQAGPKEARKWRLFALGSSGPLNHLRKYVQSARVIGGPKWNKLQEEALMRTIGPVAFVRLVTAGAFDV